MNERVPYLYYQTKRERFDLPLSPTNFKDGQFPTMAAPSSSARGPQPPHLGLSLSSCPLLLPHRFLSSSREYHMAPHFPLSILHHLGSNDVQIKKRIPVLTRLVALCLGLKGIMNCFMFHFDNLGKQLILRLVLTVAY
ncbi:unnamed protein product [Citrullus colocynthis]|uniref:Uncharacterized protein n=1 Tax=Citrullus colocynthis TaxID=252529 RepID=A0ABP0YLH4_9ROSI